MSDVRLLSLETIQNIAMQQRDYHTIRLIRYKDIDALSGAINLALNEEPGKVFAWLIEASIE